MQKFEREGFILNDPPRNRQANELLATFATQVDILGDALKKGGKISPEQNLYLSYYQTVQAGTDKLNNRQKREDLLRKLLEPLFESKDSKRTFSMEQRRVIWNSTMDPTCTCDGQCGRHSSVCGVTLTWGNFTIDHIKPYSRGVRTTMANADLMCRSCNAAKGNRSGLKQSAAVA
jgi:5-methylcytosine-specific restriction endonuclease McrA